MWCIKLVAFLLATVYILIGVEAQVYNQRGISVYVTTTRIYIDSSQDLIVVIEVQVVNNASSYNAANILTLYNIAGPTPLCVSQGTTGQNQSTPFTDSYTFTQCSSPGGPYAGNYSFASHIMVCNSTSGACSSFNAYYSLITDMTVNTPVTAYESFSTQLQVYTDSTFTAPMNSVVYQGQSVCVLDRILGLNAQGQGIYYITIVQVYMCAASGGATILYDGVSNLGCLGQASIITIVNNSQIVPTADPSYYRATLYQYVNQTASGICIKARPVLQDPSTLSTYGQGAGQYMHVIAYVSNGASNYTYTAVLPTQPPTSPPTVSPTSPPSTRPPTTPPTVPGHKRALLEIEWDTDNAGNSKRYAPRYTHPISDVGLVQFFVDPSYPTALVQEKKAASYTHERVAMVKGAIAGTVIGGFVFIALLALLVWFVALASKEPVYKRKKGKDPTRSSVREQSLLYYI
jgi:hypothetical protein